MTTGLKEAILEFFSWESLGAGSAGLRCRAGAAGLLCRAAGASRPVAKKKRAAVLPPHEDLLGRRGREAMPDLTVPGLLAIRAICAISHKASH